MVTVALADSILWQRASYRRESKDPREDDDLLRLLDTPKPLPPRSFDGLGLKREFEAWTERADVPIPTKIPRNKGYELTHQLPGIDPYVASAILRLKDRGKLQEALQMPRIQRLSTEARQALLDVVPTEPAEARQALLDEVPTKPIVIKQHPVKLIKDKKWRDCIDLLEPRVAQSASDSFLDHFFLAMAFWGIGDETRTKELCHLTREEQLERSTMESILQEQSIELIPAWSLVFWNAGDSAAAKKFLDHCDESLTAAREDLEDDSGLFSVWRFRPVKPAQFVEDCHEQRLMIQGANIPPPFLGKALVRA